jgi:hypothetical protein
MPVLALVTPVLYTREAPLPFIVMVLFALAPNIGLIVSCSLYGPLPGSTLNVTGPFIPHLTCWRS